MPFGRLDGCIQLSGVESKQLLDRHRFHFEGVVSAQSGFWDVVPLWVAEGKLIHS